MEVTEASFNGTLRTILWLVLAWMALRWFLQYQRNAAARRNAHANAHQNTPSRAKGEVRIENVPPAKRPGDKSGGTIVDADFEEIK
ncbi:MAG TPA: hypothetical protein PLB89_01365 [Flavobacteriales bacterium]|nr:hypothetical protein [Flavobacteriales bacterium]